MQDRFVVRSVVVFLGVATLIGLMGLIWLVDQGKASDAALLAVVAGPTGSALGALSALLVHTGSEPTPTPTPPGTPTPAPVPAPPSLGEIRTITEAAVEAALHAALNPTQPADPPPPAPPAPTPADPPAEPVEPPPAG